MIFKIILASTLVSGANLAPPADEDLAAPPEDEGEGGDEAEDEDRDDGSGEEGLSEEEGELEEDGIEAEGSEAELSKEDSPRSEAGGVTEADPEPEPEPAPERMATPEAESETPAAEGPTEDPEEEGPDESGQYKRKVVVGSLLGSEGVPRVAGSAHAISEKELEKHEHDDIHKVLATVPGVYVRGEDGFGLRPNIGLRGANSDRSAKVTLMEDGILLGPAPYAAPAAYYFPLTTRMAGVEIFKGPASVRHGPNTIGGALNMRTRQIPVVPIAFVDVAGGRFGYGKAHSYLGTTYKGFGILLEGARVQSRGFKELDSGNDTGFGKNDTMLKLGYQSPDSGRLKHIIELKGGFANERSHETYLGLSDEDFAENPYYRYPASELGLMKWWRTQGEVTYVLSDQKELEFEARLYRHDFHRAWRKFNQFRGEPDVNAILRDHDAGQAQVFYSIMRGETDSSVPGEALMIGTNDRTYVSEGVSTALRWRPRWKAFSQELELGVRIHGDSIKRNHFEEPHNMLSGVLVPEASDPVTTADNTGSVFAAAFHLYDAMTFADRFTVAPGVRVELISSEFDDRLNDATAERFDAIPVPGLGAHVRVTDWLGIFGGVHRGFSPVAPGQPKEIHPEFSINYEAGARVVWEGLHGEAIGFFSDYANLTGECTFSSGCDDTMISRQFNAGKVFVYGVESLLRYEHGWESGLRASVGGLYTYTGSQFQTSFDSGFPQFGTVQAGDSLPYVPQHVAGGSAGVGGKIWDVHAKLNYTGPMRDIAGQGAIPAEELIPGYAVLDLAAEVSLMGRLRLYALVNNATATRYMVSRRPFGARPGPPLVFMFGVKAFITKM